MQLRPKKERKVGQFLAKASLALICSTSNIAKAQNQPVIPPKQKSFFTRNSEGFNKWAKWSGELGFLGYSETKGRVQALEPAIQLNAEFEGERVWSSKLVLDSLTGASPNGALNSDQPQTFTSPSGSASYSVNAGEQPLYNQFLDTRVNLATTWSAPLSRLWKYAIGFNGSSEYDYLSLGLNSSVTKESADKNTSWSAGLSYTKDTVRPVGGVPTPLATMVSPSAGAPRQGAQDSKNTYDFLFGFSQVMTRSWIVQANLSLGLSEGYMNDPYKFVTVFDEGLGPNLGNPTSYLHEDRPKSRFKKSVYVASKKQFDWGILSTSYRYLFDDWGLNSHTVDAAFNFGISPHWRLEPGIRYYKQGAVDFYKLAIGAGQAVSTTITADYRLGNLTTLAPTLKIIRKLDNDKELGLILRYYQQSSSTEGFDPVGSQVGQDLAPKTDAYIAQILYSF